MPLLRALVVGSHPACDLVLSGVAPRHVELSWNDGLILRDLGVGQVTVDGRLVAPNASVPLPAFHMKVMLGGVRLNLTNPKISLLYLERSSLPLRGSDVVIGRDSSRAHIVVAHSTVSSAHANVNLDLHTVTDLGSRSGTFDRNAARLAPNAPCRLDDTDGVFISTIWVPAQSIRLLVSPSTPVVRNESKTDYAPVTLSPRSATPEIPISRKPSDPNAGLTALAAPPPGVNLVPMPGPSGKAASHDGAAVKRTVFGSFDGGGAEAIVGRVPSCDIVLPFPQVSAKHCSLARSSDGQILVKDLGSTNGTYVNGHRIQPNRAAKVTPGTRIFVGPNAVIVGIENGRLTAYIEQEQAEWAGNLVEIEAIDVVLKVPDRDKPSTQKVLLNRITFKARPGDLIALMGPSGAGKTTLLMTLNGYLRPSSGEVRVNGENLYAIYDALRGSIGYVPQDDIVHPELTVFEAIKYSARFRLPPDYTDEEIERRVEQTIKDLGLEQVKNLEIGKPEKKVLSGGQRKRVNIALELVTDPALLFLDEPTSGLAADDTVALIDLLANLAKKSGKTIIVTIHQPAREEYEKFNLALIMGFGGEPVFFGPTGSDSYGFFGRYAPAKPVDNPRDMFDLLKKREEDMQASGRFPSKAEARLAAARCWREEFFHPQNPVHQRMYTGAREPGKAGQDRPPKRAAHPALRQLKLLIERYAIIKRRDKVGAAILLLQAPIIGGLLAAVYTNPTKMPNLWCQMTVQKLEAAAQCTLPDPSRFTEVADYSGALFFMVVASMWFGTSNAAREIVSEQAFYRRERMVNLSILNYVMSKFALLTGLCIVQCFTMLAIVYPALGLGGDSWSSFPSMLAILVTTSMCAGSMGLLISTLVQSSEAAMALTPIALIPQIILGGRMVPMTSKEWLKPAMALIPARWSFEGVLSAERKAVESDWGITTCAKAADGVELGKYQCALEELRNATKGAGGLGFTSYDDPKVAYGTLFGMTLLMMVAVVVMLKRRDSV